jgi:DNA-binding CsgD family transcriptional regulator
MPHEKAKRELLRLTYECAADPRHWPLLLEEFAKTFKAESAALVVQDLKDSRGSVVENWGVEPLWQSRYAEHYAATNVWTQRAEHLLQPGVPLASERLITDSEMVKTEFYNDFLRPQNSFYGFGGALLREDSVSSFITALRSKKAGPYRAPELLLLAQLMPHLRSALRLRQRIAGLEQQVSQLSSALDHLAQGMIIASQKAQVIFMNRRAETIIREKDGLWLAPDGLCASRAVETGQLRESIARVATVQNHPGSILSLDRAGKGPLKLLIAPLLPSLGHFVRKPAALIWIAFPEPVAVTSPALLERLFQFTRAEARLAAALLEGKSLQEFSAEAGVTLHTAKTHLKNLFTKTGVSRQAGLVRLVLNVVSQLGKPR